MAEGKGEEKEDHKAVFGFPKDAVSRRLKNMIQNSSLN